MNDLSSILKSELTNQGADLIGIGNLSEIPERHRKDMPFGVSVAIAIEPAIIKGISQAPTKEYYEAYCFINDKLDKVVTRGAAFLQKQGYVAYPQTGAVVAENETEYTSILPHKTVATRAGIGWIGKSALLVTKLYGSAVRISTILTNAPLKADQPIDNSLCGDCLICTKACPAKAVKGVNWSISKSREEFFDPVKCREVARNIAKGVLDKEITLCGKCIYVCPYTQKYIHNIV